jgi:hypothetical protein
MRNLQFSIHLRQEFAVCGQLGKIGGILPLLGRQEAFDTLCRQAVRHVCRNQYRARALSEPRHKSSHEHHAYYYKAEVIVTTTKAIIAGFFSVATL